MKIMIRYEEYMEMYDIVGAAMEVYNVLGRGMEEAIYQEALELELKKRESSVYIRSFAMYPMITS